MKLKARQIPLPTVRKWSQEGVSFFLRSRAAKAFFTMVYLGFNIYIVVVPLIGPYRNANKDSLEVRGWVYIVIVGSIFTAAVIYYYMAFGYKQTFDANLNTVKPTRTIARWANACPLLCEEPIHDQQYGVRRKVEMVYEKTVSLFQFSTCDPITNNPTRNRAIYTGCLEGPRRSTIRALPLCMCGTVLWEDRVILCNHQGHLLGICKSRSWEEWRSGNREGRKQCHMSFLLMLQDPNFCRRSIS
jgi:hypothetical protein